MMTMTMVIYTRIWQLAFLMMALLLPIIESKNSLQQGKVNAGTVLHDQRSLVFASIEWSRWEGVIALSLGCTND
jgi:hypothetical protein